MAKQNTKKIGEKNSNLRKLSGIILHLLIFNNTIIIFLQLASVPFRKQRLRVTQSAQARAAGHSPANSDSSSGKDQSPVGSIISPNTLNLGLDPEFWPSLDLNPGLDSYSRLCYKKNFKSKNNFDLKKQSFLKTKRK